MSQEEKEEAIIDFVCSLPLNQWKTDLSIKIKGKDIQLWKAHGNFAKFIEIDGIKIFNKTGKIENLYTRLTEFFTNKNDQGINKKIDDLYNILIK